MQPMVRARASPRLIPERDVSAVRMLGAICRMFRRAGASKKPGADAPLKPGAKAPTKKVRDELHPQFEMPRMRSGISDQPAARVRDVLRSAGSDLRLPANPRRHFAQADRIAPPQFVALPRVAAGRQRARGRAVLRLHSAGAD